MNYFDMLKEACEKEGLTFDDTMYDNFIEYKALIKEWNEKINLTTITEDEEIIKKHFIDSIKVFKFPYVREAKNIIDIGTGGGFPGIPMKIVKADCSIVLLDSLNKRINFLNKVIDKLELDDIRTIHGRAEDFAQKAEYREKFDLTVSRAVANLTVLLELCLPYVKIGGYFVALKGPSIEDEIKDAKVALRVLGGSIEEIIEVDIAGSDLKHNLLVIKKVKDTPKKYPRKAGTANKSPIK
jgi:16S rRNA (guanine527-N7)-methyltransferase